MVILKIFQLVLGVFLVVVCSLNVYAIPQNESGVRVKDLVRIVGIRDNSLVGYGIVAGLAGTGDSIRSRATIQSITNTLARFGLNIKPEDLRSRNVAAVMVTTKLPPFSRPGDKLDVNVTSIGDSRSLVGGTLLMMHLKAPNGKIYALAQGPLTVGGYKYDLNGNVVQKNHPTAGLVPNGAIVEVGVKSTILSSEGFLQLKINNPDYTTAGRIANSINKKFGNSLAKAVDAGRVKVQVPQSYQNEVVQFVMNIEKLSIQPDTRSKIIINERTGTVVSGGDVTISKVTIAHGDLKVSIVTDFLVSQPFLVRETSAGVRTQVVPSTRIDVEEQDPISLSLPGGTSVADLVTALRRIKTSSRDIITILQGIKSAGALHAELIVQ